MFIKIGDLISYKDFYGNEHHGVVVERFGPHTAKADAAYYVWTDGELKTVRHSNAKVISESR